MRRIRYFLRGRLFPCALLFLLLLAGGIALALLLPRLLAPIAALERAFSFVVALIVIAGNDLPERKISKLVLLFLPWMGAILCLWFFRCPCPVPLRDKPGDGQDTLLFRASALSARMTGLSLSHADRVEYFPVGREMYERLLEDLERAEERIWLEYYIVARGVFWGSVLEILDRKVKEGVDVRLIYDDFGCSFTLPDDYAAELERRGIRATVFRRVKVGRDFSRRDHRKLAILDDVCYTGGINLADEYIGEKLRFGHWKDSAIRMEGGISAFSELFLRTWYALRPSDGISAPPRSREGDIPVVAVSDSSEERARLFPDLITLLAAHARERLWLFTPYLSLPRTVIDAFVAAARAGVDVRLMIPHIPDKKPVFFLSRAYARMLIAAGVEVREYTPGFLHAKSAVVDGKYALVSSYNLDFRSLYVQAECGALVRDDALAEALERDFTACWEQGAPVKRANLFLSFLGKVCTLFAPLT